MLFLNQKNRRIVHETLVEGRVLALALDLEANQLSFFWEAGLSSIHIKKSDEKRHKISRSGILDRFINSIYVHVDETRGSRAMV